MARGHVFGAIALLLVLAAPAGAAPDPALEARVTALLGRMTLDEKIGQLNLGANNPDFRESDVEAGRFGGVLAFTTGRDIASVQAAARRSRHGIPLLVGLDVLHGLRTMFPLPMAEAGSFDPDLARAVAAQSARESVAIGINWTFAPMADLARDPRWGRSIEGFGEDPFLGQVFTRARVEGFRAGGLAVTLKHFAGYGAAAGGRDYDAATIDGADLHDAYLPPFQAGIDAGAETVMSAFHTLNGVPASADPGLLTGTLRGRLGFDGFVVSDWYAVEQLQDHGVAADGREAAIKALRAGVDMDMASGLYARHLGPAVASGAVPEEAVTEAARRVLRTKLRMGLLDRPPVPLTPEAPPPSADARALAKRAARDTIVLLRNDGTLPLAPGRRVALVGGIAESAKDLVGPHGALVKYEDGVTVAAALRARIESAGGTLAVEPGCDAACGDDSGFDAAVAAARAADVVVAVLGEAVELTGEAGSRAHLGLPGRQAALLDRLVETGRPVVLVLVASRPLTLGPVVDRLAGLMMAWFPGTEGGTALADLLAGDASPSAKLPVSWPRSVGQLPLTYDRLPTGRPPDPKNRFTLRYVDEETTPLFPFGFGLTYSRVTVSDVVAAAPRVAPDGTVTVTARVTNTGPRAAREVVQLYTRQPVGSVSRPLRRLGAFAKAALEAGESRVVTLAMPASGLGFHRPDGVRVLEPGSYQLFVGTASDAPLAATIEVAEAGTLPSPSR